MAENRWAVVVGCNYHKTPVEDCPELLGCINDAVAIKGVLEDVCLFLPRNITLLTDERNGSLIRRPTAANIKQALHEMFDKAKPGDILFFYFSGHGTSDDGEEAIVGWDGNLISRYDFRKLISRLPAGARFQMVSDSCNSGGLIDKETEQIGPSRTETTQTGTLPSNVNGARTKAIPFGTIIEHLRASTGNRTSGVKALMHQVYGNDASLKYRLSEHELTSCRQLEPDQGILLSSCQSDEYSMDSSFKGKFCSVFTFVLVQLVVQRRQQGLWCSNRLIVTLARDILRVMGMGRIFHDQHPCLYCNDANADKGFAILDHITGMLYLCKGIHIIDPL